MVRTVHRGKSRLIVAIVALALMASILAVTPGGLPSALAAPPDGPDLLADFEGDAAGFFSYNGASTVATSGLTVADTDALALPWQAGDNTVLQLDYSVTDFGGFGVSYEDPGPQDWSGTEGFSFWFYGTGSNLTYQAEISDNRSNPAADTAERFDYSFTDDTVGWRLISIPWTAFTRATDFQPGGAPDDGFGLTEIWAFAIVLPQGADTVYFDDFILDQITVDDFESPLETGEDGNGIDIGWYTFRDGDSSVGFSQAIPPALVPGLPADNNVLAIDLDVVAFAGVIHGFENEAVDTWVPQDWSTRAGMSLWMHGNNSGTDLFIDLLENRNPDSTTDDAQRWTVAFKDDWTGWRYFEFPFNTFTVKGVGNGAPTDELTLKEVHGWAFGTLGTGGPLSFYIDDVSLYGEAEIPPLTVGFSTNQFDVTEGETATVTVKLNRELGLEPADPTQVSVDYRVETIVPVEGRDYVSLPSGTLTFEAGGPTELSFAVDTLDDGKYEDVERLILLLDNPVDVALGAVLHGWINIENDDPYNPLLLDDFERFPHLWDSDGVLDNPEIPAGDPLAVPGQGDYERILEVTGGTSVARHFAIGQDWSDIDELTFWHYGQNTGEEITVELLDNSAPDPGPGGWSMVWSDEFNEPAGTLPNPANWGYEIGDGTMNGIPGWGNSELQYYTDDPANVSTDGDGNLVITLEEADGSLDCYYGPCEYTSARLISWHTAEFAYGRIESRILVPDGDAGLWPAFWSLGTDIDLVGWPQTGEIDIMEYVSRIPDEIFGTIHGPGYSGGNAYGNTYPFPGGVATDYHTFTIEWQPDLIEWYVDDILYHTATPADVAPNEWVFNDPVYLLLNLAVGGNFGGPLAETLTFPQSMKVDYVRVYQADDTAERFEATIVDDVDGWHQVVVPLDSFTRSADQPAGAPDDGLTLTEVNGYGFTVPASGLVIDQVLLVEAPPPTEVVVTTLANSGSGSLRDAIDRVADGGTITFDPALAGGTIALTGGPLVVGKAVAIDGGAAPGLAVDGGGADRVLIVNQGASAHVSDLTLTGGYGWQLGGCVINNGELTLERSTVTGCTMDTDAGDFWQGGGGIYTGGGASLSLIDSTVSDNTAAWSGGGIYGFFDSTTTIVGSTISGNVSADVGGGIRSLANATIVNSTISGNQSLGWYGGALFGTDGVIDMSFSTITANVSPPWAPAAVFVGTFGPSSATLNVDNSIIAGNVTEGCFLAPFGAGAVAINSLGNNVFTDGTCFPVASDQVVADAGLEPLADNGGPTLTHALVFASAAMDAADAAACPAVDQRGEARPQLLGCDVGAFEADIAGGMEGALTETVMPGVRDLTYSSVDGLQIRHLFRAWFELWDSSFEGLWIGDGSSLDMRFGARVFRSHADAISELLMAEVAGGAPSAGIHETIGQILYMDRILAEGQLDRAYDMGAAIERIGAAEAAMADAQSALDEGRYRDAALHYGTAWQEATLGILRM